MPYRKIPDQDFRYMKIPDWSNIRWQYLNLIRPEGENTYPPGPGGQGQRYLRLQENQSLKELKNLRFIEAYPEIT